MVGGGGGKGDLKLMSSGHSRLRRTSLSLGEAVSKFHRNRSRLCTSRKISGCNAGNADASKQIYPHEPHPFCMRLIYILALLSVTTTVDSHVPLPNSVVGSAEE